jgi:hypothetical protein
MRDFVIAGLQHFAGLSCRPVAYRGYPDKKPEKELIVHTVLGTIIEPDIWAISQQENDRGGNKRTGISRNIRI